MRKHSTRLAIAMGALSVTLAACGTSTTPSTSAADDVAADQDVAPEEAAGDPFAMCAPGVPNCADTAEDPQVDPEAKQDERLMSDEVPIVTGFHDPLTRVIESAPGTVADPFALFLQEAVIDGRIVMVSFNAGQAPCFVVDHVEFEETDDAIVVRVLAGQPDPDADCSTDGTSMQAVAFELSSDLGARQIHDGSRNAPDGANV